MNVIHKKCNMGILKDVSITHHTKTKVHVDFHCIVCQVDSSAVIKMKTDKSSTLYTKDSLSKPTTVKL